MSQVTRATILPVLLLAFVVGPVSAQSWSEATPLTFPRTQCVAQAIGSDIYVLGGQNLATLERFDTGAETWSMLAPMSTDRTLFGAGAIDGKIYVAGGQSSGAVALSSGAVYDPGTDRWSEIASLPVTLAAMASAVYEGRLYLFSGSSANGGTDPPQPGVFVYDPAADEWTRLTDMPRPRKSGVAVTVGDRIYVIGGLTQAYGIGGCQAWVDVYDPNDDSWTTAPDLPRALALHTAVLCRGRLWTLGGLDEWPDFVTSVYSYRPGAPAWREELGMPAALISLGAAVDADAATIYTFGGNQDEAHGFASTDAVYKRAVNEPDIVSVSDVPNDEGGKVSIRWLASVLDRAPGNPIDEYWIWREVPTAAAMQALGDRTTTMDDRGTVTATDGRVFRLTAATAEIHYWEYIGRQVAHGFAAYSFTAPTLFDSLPDSDPYTYFMVEAEQLGDEVYWSSVPVSGHSIDNLAPEAVSQLAATYDGSATTLHWLPSASSDVASYNIYRSTSPWFEPGPENLLARTTDTSHVDRDGVTFCYKLAPVDIHGNQGSFATLVSSAFADVATPVGSALGLSAPRPNPATRATEIRFTLSQDGPASLEIFDASGRRVRTLESGVVPAGEHSVRFELTDGRGRRLGVGLYFLRLSAEGRVLGQRLCVID